MNLLDMLVSPKLYSRTDRERRIAQEGSPVYTWTPAIIAATAFSKIDLNTQFPASRKYAPLDRVEIVNNDVVNLTVTLNGTEAYAVPAGVIRTIGDNDKIGITECQVTNLDAAVASIAGMIVLRFQRKPVNVDNLARRLLFSEG